MAFDSHLPEGIEPARRPCEGGCLSFAWWVSARERGRSDEDGVVHAPIWVLP
jgi:hypothetical protein